MTSPYFYKKKFYSTIVVVIKKCIINQMLIEFFSNFFNFVAYIRDNI